MFDLNEKDALAKVYTYELIRSDKTSFSIDVLEIIAIGGHKVINKNPKVEFMAVPKSVIKTVKAAYMGRGNSIEEALSDCLSKIKNVASHTIFGPQQSSSK